METIKSKEEILLESLTKYFYNNKNIDYIIPIITGNSNLSLRAIDWFVTNYSHKYNIIYPITKKKNLQNFNVYNCYKNQLKAYNKRFFDPFCRVNKNNLIKRIIFKYNDDNYIQTTIGQINFFKWAVENNILMYINDNYNDIYNDMNIKIVKTINIDKTTNNKNKLKSTLLDFNNNNNNNNINKNNNNKILNNKKHENINKSNYNFRLSL